MDAQPIDLFLYIEILPILALFIFKLPAGSHPTTNRYLLPDKPLMI
jgi:hypothetical protein